MQVSNADRIATSSSRRMFGRVVIAASLTACCAPMARAQVSSLNLEFNAPVAGTAGSTGFDSAYGLNTDGFNVNSGGNGALGLLTLPGDTFGDYGGTIDPGGHDPDSAQNMFYTSFAAGTGRTVVQAKLSAFDLNQNFHGGGIWMGTDQDHYIRLGLVFNSFEGGANTEALRENEDRWTGPGGQPYTQRPGGDIDSRQYHISTSATPTVVGGGSGVDVNNAILRIVRDNNAVACFISLDNGVTFNNVGGTNFSFNSLAYDANSLPIDNRTDADPNSTDKTSHTVEGGFKVGVQALGGGNTPAILQYDYFHAITGTPTWTSGDGEYTTDANWSNNNGLGAPTGIESTAVLAQSAAARTLTVSSDIAATNIAFNSTNGYTLNGTGNILLDYFYSANGYYSDGPGAISVTGGNNVINAPIAVAHEHTFNIASGASLKLTNFAGTSLANNLDAGVLKAGAGTLMVNHLVTHVVDVQAGTLQVLASGTSAGLSVVNSLNVVTTAGSTAKLDITNNALVVDYDGAGTSPLTAIGALIKSGRGAAGTWTGAGITSSAAAANSSKYSIGYGPSSDFATVPALFGTVDSSAVLIRYTYRGDFNLSGTVDFDDLLALAKNYNGTSKIWDQGDSDYDGDVDFDDLLALAKNYNATPALGSAQIALLGADVAGDFKLARSLVPEPTLVLSSVGFVALAGRRRR